MNRIEEQLAERLKTTFKQYIRHAIKHALHEEESTNDVLQVIVNMQAALELLSKLYVLQREGWQGVVDARLHDKTESEVLLAIEEGTLKTTPYWKSKAVISKEIYLNDDDQVLLDKFHNHRNQMIHLGITNPSRAILNESIWFIVRIIHQLDWQDTLPGTQQYFTNSLKFLLGDSLYEKLMTSSCYVSEAIDRADELHDDVTFCIQCGKKSWALNDELYRICLVCGYKGTEDALGFVDCPVCNAKGTVVYDALNIDANEHINGKCCSCQELIAVSQCTQCENVYKYPGNCECCGND